MGRAFTGRELTASEDRTPLPIGFHYSNPRRMRRRELGSLWRHVKNHEAFETNFASNRRYDARAQDAVLLEAAVRDQDGGLAGYGGVLCKGEKGEMRNFVVHPDRQGQGLGKAIILERMRMAEQYGVRTLVVPRPLETNTLVPFYIEHGFIEQQDGDLVRAISPGSSSHWQ